MPFNGSGQFIPLAFPLFPAQPGALIKSSDYNSNFTDVFWGLSNCLTRDGQSPPTADLPMAGFTFTGLSAPAASGEPLVFGSDATIKDLDVTQTINVAGAATFNGGVTFGNTAADPFTVVSTTITWGAATTHTGQHQFNGTGAGSTAVIVGDFGAGSLRFLAGTALNSALMAFFNNAGTRRAYAQLPGSDDYVKLDGEQVPWRFTTRAPQSAVAASGATDLVRKQEMDAALPIGSIQAMARLTAPVGWLLIDGKTIGSAASGATSRANADTATLYGHLWDFTAIPIYDSAGVLTTRGASAAADFSANKRLPLFTPDGGYFLRMWAPGQTLDAGRAAGSTQADAIKATTGSAESFITDLVGSSAGALSLSLAGPRYAVPPDGGGGQAYKTLSLTVGSGPETRPHSLAVPHYIRYL